MAGMEQFHYDPSKPIEQQIAAFLAGRDPHGQVGDNWFQNPSLYSVSQSGDESGTSNFGYNSLDPRVANVSPSVSPDWSTRIVDGQYTPVTWMPSNDPSAINGMKPDNMSDYGQMYYDPKYGLLTTGSNVRDPDARQDLWYSAGLLSAVAGPAIAGILGGAGAAGGLSAGGGGAGGAGGAFTGGGWGAGADLGAGGAGGAAGGTGGGFTGGGWGAGANVGGAGSGGFTGGGWGVGGDLGGGSSGLLGGGAGGSGGVGGGGAVTGTSGTPWYQSILQSAMNNPLNTARTIGGLYSMLSAGQNQGGPPANSNMSGPGGLLGTAPQFNPPPMQPFQQNPYLLAAMQSVPFMRGSNNVGF